MLFRINAHLPTYLCIYTTCVCMYIHLPSLYCVFVCVLIVRRDKLWIAMEFCGGGSLQDIYHGRSNIHS